MKKEILKQIKKAIKNISEMPGHVEVEGNQIILFFHENPTPAETKVVTITVSETVV